MPRKRKEEVTIEPGKGLNLDPELIKQLVPGTLDRCDVHHRDVQFRNDSTKSFAHQVMKTQVCADIKIVPVVFSD
ncbi:hypothetical protein [Burkholderia sp. AU38729]|uniref:hypothetical protein n=1 Tax=Burkholderia sp. AU38729 TaxID=2879633 RepID=UPI001CF4C4CD|nr:hypothetical protein [Burkholderia sp. AU38729]MCA8060735.1 hypothetical protein [Burkholderia sp. AU38729]